MGATAEFSVEELRLDGWTVWSSGTKGHNHDRMEDARTILGGIKLGRGVAHVLGVFDGVGGLPGAFEASRMAANHAGQALQQTDTALAALHHLNGLVAQTGGATTAIMAILHPEFKSAEIVSVGDGGAYTLDSLGRLRHLTPKDQRDATHLTDNLGWVGCKGHEVHVERCDRLLICTDGVDAVVDLADLRAALASPVSEGRSAVQRLLASVDAKDRPDDATVILAIRRSR